MEHDKEEKIGSLNDFMPGSLLSCFRQCGKRWSDISEAGKSVRKRCLLRIAKQNGKKYGSREEADMALIDYIEVCCNKKRKHASIGRIPPVVYKERLYKKCY